MRLSRQNQRNKRNTAFIPLLSEIFEGTFRNLNLYNHNVNIIIFKIKKNKKPYIYKTIYTYNKSDL